jgi:hypothetical protein
MESRLASKRKEESNWGDKTENPGSFFMDLGPLVITI